MARFVLVKQSNWREVRERNGRTYTEVSYRPPATMADVESGWPGCRLLEWDGPDAPTTWGHATYSVGDDGALSYVADNFDSSD